MHAVIVGNGIAGVTAARHVRKADPGARITLVSDETPTPFSRTALMYVYMGVLTRSHTYLYEDRFWAESRIERIHDRALGLDPARRSLALRDGGGLAYDRLLVATGSVPFLPDWPGADLDVVQGLYHLRDLDRMEASTRGVERAVVVGGGLIGVELAEMLRTRGVAVVFLVREDRYFPRVFSPTESALVADEIRRHGVDLRLGSEVVRVEGTDRVEAVVTTDGERVEAGFVGVGTGVRANVGWLDGAVEVGRQGVLVDPELRTSAGGVWAAGDCAELRDPPPGTRARDPIWYAARRQGATAGLGMAGQPRPYAPGVYFNSAKFFDLEWQVYGATSADGEDWEWSDGRRSLRLRHAGGVVRGVNALGVRMRAEDCTRWIAERWTLERALGALESARFDAELSGRLALP